MASSNVMSSSSSGNSDLTAQPPLYTLTSKTFGSMNMEDLFRNIYGDNPTEEIAPPSGGGDSDVGGDDRKMIGSGNGLIDEMTLEDFLAKAGAGRGDDVRAFNGFQQQVTVEGSNLGFVGEVNGGGRGKRRAIQEPAVDRVSQQRQKRMIKNRESAARSRERKQAYTMELESMVAHLQMEHAELVRLQRELNQKRRQQLMEYLIPVEEKKRPPRVHRKTRSMNW